MYLSITQVLMVYGKSDLSSTVCSFIALKGSRRTEKRVEIKQIFEFLASLIQGFEPVW